MRVEMSLAEVLINAITHGRVRGVQFKRGWSDDKATFDDLQKVIGGRLDDALQVAREDGLRWAGDDHARARKAVFESGVREGERLAAIATGDPVTLRMARRLLEVTRRRRGGVAGQMITAYTCAACGLEGTHGNTAVPELCDACEKTFAAALGIGP